MSTPILQVADLDVRFTTPDGPVHAVRKLSFDVSAGETLGIVGESGSGKSQTVLAVMNLLADNGSASGSTIFDGQEILNLPPAQMNRIRGERIAMIFQDPMTSLNPYLTIGRQMSEVLCMHQGNSRKAALKRCAYHRSRTTTWNVSARTIGRHATARDDRVCTIVPPVFVDCG